MKVRTQIVLVLAMIAALLATTPGASAQETSNVEGTASNDHGHDHSGHDGHDHSDDDLAPDDGFVPSPEIVIDKFGSARGPVAEADLPPSLAPCVLHAQALAGTPSLRDHAGLTNDVNVRQATVERDGMLVTPAEDAILRRADEVRAAIDVKSISDAYEGRDDFLGTRWDPSTTTMTVLVTGSSEPAPASVSEQVDNNRNLQIETIESRLSAEELLEAQDLLVGRISALELTGTVQWDLDITCGRIMVLVEDTDDLAAVERLARSGISEVILAPELTDEPADRYDHHHNNQDGGLGLRPFRESPGTFLGNCTSSIAFTHPNGYEYAVTAAHCLRGLSSASTSMQWQCGARFTQGGYFISPANHCVRYQMGGSVDVAIVAKNSNESGDPESVYNGSTHARVTMAGFDDDRSDSSTGDQMCHTGRNWTGTPCGTISNFNSGACFAASGARPAYCVSNTIRTTMTAIGGDSGATVYTTRGGTRRYAGVVMTNVGRITHNEDIIDTFGVDGMVS